MGGGGAGVSRVMGKCCEVMTASRRSSPCWRPSRSIAERGVRRCRGVATGRFGGVADCLRNHYRSATMSSKSGPPTAKRFSLP